MDFDRVQLAAIPRLQDAIACEQSQAALLSVASSFDLPLIYYRKGVCSLVQAVMRKDPAQYRDAAQQFDRAIAAWVARAPEPPSPAVRTLAAVARLRGGTNQESLAAMEKELKRAQFQPNCVSAVMSAKSCQAALELGKFWLGWIADQRGDVWEAWRIFSLLPGSGWEQWVDGKRMMSFKRYAEAAAPLQSAIQAWTAATKQAAPGLFELLRPEPDLPAAYEQLGFAKFLSGDYSGAIQPLDAAIRGRPQNAFAIFVRGSAKDRLGQTQPALADYHLAARTAFANVTAPFSGGQAHFYQGVRLFRKQEYGKAEEELASALNFNPGDSLRPDVHAWRHMAAVASGACQHSARQLEEDLRQVSDFFPKEEARSWLAGCRSVSELR